MIGHEYSRSGLYQWLLGLPDEPFCDDEKCPIATYMGSTDAAALREDFELAYAIDQVLGSWSEIRPGEVIELIDRLESGDYERIDTELPF